MLVTVPLSSGLLVPSLRDDHGIGASAGIIDLLVPVAHGTVFLHALQSLFGSSILLVILFSIVVPARRLAHPDLVVFVSIF